MSISVKDKKKRAHLSKKQKNRCYYCKSKVVDSLERNDFYNRIKRPPPDNTATLEHLYPKEDIRRLLVNNYQKIVVACYRCNQIKNDEFAYYLKSYDRQLINIKSILMTNQVFVCELPDFREFKKTFSSRDLAKKEYRKFYTPTQTPSPE